MENNISLNKELFYKNPLNITDEEIVNFPVRNTTRAVMLTPENKIVLIKSENDIHTLPGGGVEKGETIQEGLIRECKEETGYDVIVISALGNVKIIRKNYISSNFGFIVKTKGIQSELNLTEAEIFLGHVVEEYTLDEAIDLINKDLKINTKYDERSVVFLKEAKKYLDNILK